MVSSIGCKRLPQGRVICQAGDGMSDLFWTSLRDRQPRFAVFNYILHSG